jgi:hypothetical protein
MMAACGTHMLEPIILQNLLQFIDETFFGFCLNRSSRLSRLVMLIDADV